MKHFKWIHINSTSKSRCSTNLHADYNIESKSPSYDGVSKVQRRMFGQVLTFDINGLVFRLFQDRSSRNKDINSLALDIAPALCLSSPLFSFEQKLVSQFLNITITILDLLPGGFQFLRISPVQMRHILKETVY